MEFAFYHAQRRAGLPPSSGSMLPHILDSVREDGQPLETGWPYLAAVPADVSKWGPPTITEKYRRASDHNSGSFSEIVSHITAGSPPVLLFLLGERFYIPDRNGMIRSAAGEVDVAGHAVVAVATGRNNEGNWLLVRNSWGATWGIGGHAWVSEDYMANRLRWIAVLKERL
ncbi:C1 family peptidase [Prosthecomicrobium hirschii]|uniref:C1 family peptidase n=1 Tax=Prosthecodimorpha hirschii TaxID=665126 RepID=UPI00221E41C9|nr:hypothetical protein [Prosthecomicrobium hirschii]